MKSPSALRILVPTIIGLALIAAGGGLYPAAGQPFRLVNFREEDVTINAGGLYYWDMVSSAAQIQANDAATLFLALPLMTISAICS